MGILDGQPTDMRKTLVVAMSEVINLHSDLNEIANLSPGWSATRAAVGGPWSLQRDDWAQEER
jgi:hypothetical protein